MAFKVTWAGTSGFVLFFFDDKYLGLVLVFLFSCSSHSIIPVMVNGLVVAKFEVTLVTGGGQYGTKWGMHRTILCQDNYGVDRLMN